MLGELAPRASPIDAATTSIGLDIEEEPVGQANPLALQRWPNRARVADMLGQTRAGVVHRDALELGPAPYQNVYTMEHRGRLSPPVAEDEGIRHERPRDLGRKNEG